MISALKRKLSHFLELPGSEKILIAYIFILLGLSYATIFIRPFRSYSKSLGVHTKNLIFIPLLTPAEIERTRRVGLLVRATAKITPWPSKCLAQAMVASRLLKHENIPYILYFGLAKNSNPQDKKLINAHAWVSAGPVNVTGGKSLHQFAVVASYISPLLKTVITRKFM